MKNISINELNDLFVDTLEKCTFELIHQNDEKLEYNLFEEFDVGVTSFLHEESLDRLFNKNHINNEIKQMATKLRELWFSVQNNETIRNAECVRRNSKWWKVLKLSDLIIKKKKNFDQQRGQT